MNRIFRVFGLGLIAGLILISALAAARPSSAAGLTLLTSFNGSNGNDLVSSLVQGNDGNFYGTASYGGVGDNGTVFKVTPAGDLTILHYFGDGSVPNDGANSSACLIQASDGNFYGTTQQGGSSGAGTVFKITPTGTETVLHSFCDGTVPNDGIAPFGGVIQGSDGNFYGMTYTDPVSGNGTVFKITPAGVETILHYFGDGSVPNDGINPYASLVQGRDGSFYGTTQGGGTAGGGTVFKITSSGIETLLHSFGGSGVDDGNAPESALVQGSDGNFFGTTTNGGTLYSSNTGVVFEITPAGVETVLHSFGDGSVPHDGEFPDALVQGNDGNFYGTTQYGGSAGAGTAFKITSAGATTILHNFGDGSVLNDGKDPSGALIQGTDGNFYGTTAIGGSAKQGTVFRLSLTVSPFPTITSFTPGEGPVGSAVTLIGTNLDSVSAVRFHDASATVFSASTDGTHLTVTVPPGAMKGTITVTNPAGSAKTATPFRITYAPVITSFSPTSGPVGTVVTITGTHLTGITRVRFHEADATVYSSNAAGTQLTVTVPPGAKTGTITLDNRDALATTSGQVFTVTP